MRGQQPAAPFYALAIVALAMIVLGGVMAWQAVEYFVHANAKSAAVGPAAGFPGPSASRAVWQREVLNAFDQAAQQLKSGDAASAEAQIDRAADEMEDARVRSKGATSDFFERANAALDRILKSQPASATSADAGGPDSSGEIPPDLSSQRILEHVTEARIELAAVRSAQQLLPQGTVLASEAESLAGAGSAANDATNRTAAPANLPSGSMHQPATSVKLPAGHELAESPRELPANRTIDPSSIGGNFLDASLLPDTAEILLPPETRRLSDNVRVENLTIAGASQTLDGIHWRNVTFIGTRLRYEAGPLDLQNVRFVHCTFGFPPDARGAALANTIALGQTSLNLP